MGKILQGKDGNYYTTVELKNESNTCGYCYFCNKKSNSCNHKKLSSIFDIDIGRETCMFLIEQLFKTDYYKSYIKIINKLDLWKIKLKGGKDENIK